MKLNKDLMNHISRPDTAAHAFRLLTVQQNVPPHVQLCGAAAMLELLCEHYEIPPQDVWTVVSKLLKPSAMTDQGNKHFDTVRDYIRYELE